VERGSTSDDLAAFPAAAYLPPRLSG
jgi:hypothetical protein